MNEANGSFLSQIVSIWHPDEDKVVEIKQEYDFEFSVFGAFFFSKLAISKSFELER
jgi:hypothetical protein